jgi:hypothetical protein
MENKFAHSMRGAIMKTTKSLFLLAEIHIDFCEFKLYEKSAREE